MNPMQRWIPMNGLSCRQAAKVLQTYLDGELDGDRASKLEIHLDACLDCGLEADTYREIKGALARQSRTLPEDSLSKLREFGDRLVNGELEPG